MAQFFDLESPGWKTKDLGSVDVHPLETNSRSEADSSDQSQYDFNSAEFKNIPELVRTVVGFEDDPSLPLLTFRSILLSAVVCTLGSIVPLGGFLFSLNPGPWSPKEHAVVAFLPTNAALYYNMTMNPAVALFFGWGSSLLGFAFAAMVRTILIDDPEFIFPLSLQKVTLYWSMDTRNGTDKKRAHDRMKVFWILLLETFVWQFLPEYLFPFVASLAPLCWFASRNHTVNFLGAGRGGVGLLNITLNWSNITSMVITYPYSVQCWILNPIAYFGKLWGSPTYDIMSNGGFQKNGSAYPFNDLIYLDSDGMQHVNETKYEEMGLAYLGAKCTWQMFMGPYHQDRLSRIIQKEWAALTLAPTKIYMPIWTYFVALGFGAAAMLPMSFVYAMSGFSIKVGYFNELIYGYMIEAKGSSRHPLGQLAYRIISGNVRCDARIVLEDQKIGHYLHLPPRQVIGIQIIANMLALPIIYGVMRWVLATKFECFLMWVLHRRFPRARFDLWNTTIFFASAVVFYGNLSTGPFTTFLAGPFTNFYLFRYRRVFWNKCIY
ncbi:OPT oligopeptide transporter protein-domain-containing protein [Aspergillus falconensis]